MATWALVQHEGNELNADVELLIYNVHTYSTTDHSGHVSGEYSVVRTL
jgi:hypothetical protein